MTHFSAARALRELNRIRRVELTANGRNIDLTSRRTPLQTRACAGSGVPLGEAQPVDVDPPAPPVGANSSALARSGS